MKKFLLLAIAVAVIWAAGYQLVGNMSDIPEGTQAQKVLAIFKDNGCLKCHSKKDKAPFYAEFPIFGKFVKEDIAMGIRSFDIDPTIEALESGKTVDETSLAKIEFATEGDRMPLFSYRIIHWNSKMSELEETTIMEWIKSERKKLAENLNVAEEFLNEPVRPLPESVPYDPRKAKLGSILYHHTALSGDETVSCATCHELGKGGVDGLQFSTGIREQKGAINAPTVFNAYFNKRQFWNGRAGNLEEQAGGPPMNPVEMDGGSWEKIAERLSKDSSFKKQFEEVYPDGFTEKNITDAIGQFERTLITPNCRFDKYLRGDKSALTADEIEGYKVFKKAYCSVCHSGINLGGQTFEYMGLKHDYFSARGDIGNVDDKGLEGFTSDMRDLHKFKTPSLRNIELTAPYFHDGTVHSLDKAVEIMAKYQRDVELTQQEKDNLVKFLKTLTGELNGKPLKQ